MAQATAEQLWVLQRSRDLDKSEKYAAQTPPAAECCIERPAVLEFDSEGNLLRGRGSAPGWPSTEHTIFVHRKPSVWLAGAGARDTLLRSTSDGGVISDFGLRGPTMAPGQNDQQKQDKFFVAYTTLDRGSVGSINLSADPKQNYLFVSAIMNYVVWIANRYDGAVVGKIGHAAPTGGQFHWLHVAQHGLSREPVHTVK